MFFTKKKDVKDVIEVKTTQKTHNIKFIGKFKTKEIKFFDYDPNTNKLTELGIVSMKQLEENGLSFNYDDYKEDDKLPNFKECEIKKLGDVINMLSTTKHVSSLGNKEGKYRFYNSSQTDKLYMDTFEIDKESVIIGNGGDLCVHYDIKFTPSKHVTVCQALDKINMKYLYYYLLINKDKLNKLSAGVTIQWLNKQNLSKLQIPIPNLTIQKQIADKLDFIYDKAIKTSKKKIDELKKINKICVDTHIHLLCEMKKLGDVINMLSTTKHVSSLGNKEGKYRFYNSSQTDKLYMDTFEIDKESVIIGNGGDLCVHYD